MRVLATIIAFASLAAAQDKIAAPPASPLPASPDVTLTLELREPRTQFHRGELIPIRWGYSAETGDKYVLASSPSDLEAGEGESITCDPQDATASPRPVQTPDLMPFLYAADQCLVGFGSGGGVGGCTDCHGFVPLNNFPLSYQLNLNSFVRILRAGHYVCRLRSARVTRAPVAEKRPLAMETRSNPLSFDIVDDAAWSRAAVAAAEEQMVATCDNEPTPKDDSRWQRCTAAGDTLRSLDTDESLHAAVRLYLGDPATMAYSQTEMWEAIGLSSNRSLAVELLSRRMQDPDFHVSEAFLTTLAMWELQLRHPDVVDVSTDESRSKMYHEEAVQIFRSEVRALGKSLPGKQAAALSLSLETYKHFGAGQMCDGQPLIPEQEQRSVLAGTSPR